MSLAFPPRFRLATLPTPLQNATRLRDALGGPTRAPRILIKRDDLTGLAFGGNKARKLEFLVGDATRQGASVLITSGGVQSNHARMTAAAARVAGLGVALVLSARDDPPVQGNLLLDRLLGAEIHVIPAGSDPMMAVPADESAKVRDVEMELRARGGRPYVIPLGGSSPIGALGYVAGTLELVEQLWAQGETPTRLYYASGSRGTQAGLLLGAALFGATYAVHGVAVSGGDPEKTELAIRLANEAAFLLGRSTRVTAAGGDTDQQHIGSGYGIPTRGGLEAIRMVARAEGIFLDPVYTGKAMAALIDDVRRGVIDPGETVVFLHTGGTPALFGHADLLSR
jgi:D-cysteine desulfhydrase family pyridoxal phosphate-dependent enzyme